jgi:hypothetical protein
MPNETGPAQTGLPYCSQVDEATWARHANKPLQSLVMTQAIGERPRRENSASVLLAHDAAFDEHHDQPALLFVVAQAISPGCRKGLTLLEGLPVSHLHVIHHVPHAPLLRDSRTADTDGDEDSNNQAFHVYLHGVGSQAGDGLSAKRVLMVSLASVRAVRWRPRVHSISICGEI